MLALAATSTGLSRRGSGATRAVAIAATPSPRPVRPRPSVVVPLTDTGAPTASESAACASSRRVPTFGRLPTTWTATLPISKPGLAHQTSGLGEQGRPGRPGQLGPGGAEVRPEVTDAGRREQRVAGGVRGDVGVGVAVEPALPGPVQPGDPQLAPGPSAASACTSTPTPTLGGALMASVWQAPGCGRGTLRQHPLGVLEVVAAGHLERQRVALDDDHVVAAQLDERGVVGGAQHRSHTPNQHARARTPAGSAPRAATRGRGCR